METSKKPASGKTLDSVTPERVTGYLKTYLQPAPIQDSKTASTDPQLSTLVMSLMERMQRMGDKGVLVDIGCGKGSLLQRLLLDTDFATKAGWRYVAVDGGENLDAVLMIAGHARIHQRVELVELDTFYETWPKFEVPQLVFCRNVFHELNVEETAQLLAHVAANVDEGDVFFCQDLINFREGERHNACWFPGELEACIRDHGFSGFTTASFASRSGARWFNLIADQTPSPSTPLGYEGSVKSVLAARLRQWAVWSEIGGNALRETPEGSQVVEALDLDLQLAALTRRLRDAGAFVELTADVEKRLRASEIAKAIESFVRADALKKPEVTAHVHFRERGQQLNELEDYLRSNEVLGAVTGGPGIGKTTIVGHLLATRSYGKSVVIVDAKQVSDLWGFVERVFALLGLRLAPERLSVLQNLGWGTLDMHWRRFANHYSSRIIFFIDNFDVLVDSNGAFQSSDLAAAIGILAGADGAKLIVAQRRPHLPEQLMRAARNLNPTLVRLGRYASDDTVINILDDRFDRAKAGLDTYPARLIAAIDRHPLAAKLASEILHKGDQQVLLDDRFLLELKHHLHRELWARLVDASSEEAVQLAAELRVAVPRNMLAELSTIDAVAAGLSSSALCVVNDRRWVELIASLAPFRRRKGVDVAGEPDAQIEADEREIHRIIADHYLAVYRRDDDPKWIRESYFHRMLAADGGPSSYLNSYYLRELVASADYCFHRKYDHKAALELYDVAASLDGLDENVQMHRASCMIRVGRRPAGDDEFEKLVRRYPHNVGMRTSFVDALLSQHEYAEAKQKLDVYGLKSDQSGWVAGQWGRVWLGLNEYSKAEDMFRLQLGATPLPDPKVFVNLSRALQYQGAVLEALKILKNGLQLHIGNLSIIAAYGGCLERLKRDDEALELLQPLVDAHPDRVGPALAIIKILGRRGDAYQARKVFARAKKNASNQLDGILVTAEAEVLKAEGRPEAAIQLLREQPVRDQHILGMLLECTYHFALGKVDLLDRIRSAKEALAEDLPKNLRTNMPMIVTRARLASLSNDRALFDRLLTEIRMSRIEPFEVESLEYLWLTHNPEA
jgi:tetratricopeptide (TPR) repeat protein